MSTIHDAPITRSEVNLRKQDQCESVPSVPTSPTTDSNETPTQEEEKEEERDHSNAEEEEEAEDDIVVNPTISRLASNMNVPSPPSKQEPGTLAGAHGAIPNTSNHSHSRSGSHGNGNDPSPAAMHRDSHLRETLELKGLSKVWDEEDRLAKGRAKASAITTTSAVSHTDPSSSEAPTVTMPGAQPHERPHHGLSHSQEKIRSTYLSTGLKPGAYPDRGPIDPLADPGSRRYSVSRQYEPQTSHDTNEDDISVDESEKTGRSYSNSASAGAAGRNGGDLEQGVVYDPTDGPLVEAFVVPDDEAEVNSMPSPKQAPAPLQVVEGDHLAPPDGKSGIVEADTINLTDLLLHRKMLTLIVCLICFFVVVAVIIVVLVMTVLNKGSAGNTTSSVTSNDNNNGLMPTMSPSLAMTTILPEVATPTMFIPEDNTDAASNTDAPEQVDATPSPEQTDDTEISSNNNNNNNEEPTVEPTTTVSSGTTEEPETTQEQAISVPSTMAPTISPTTLEPTMAPQQPPMNIVFVPPPTQAPTFSSTPLPTPPPTIAPTPRPTLRSTLRPTVRPTRSPTEEPTSLPPTPKPTTRDTDSPTSEPTPEVTEEATSPLVDSPGSGNGNVEGSAVEVDFTVTYAMDANNIDPSSQEQDDLDQAMVTFFTNTLESGLSSQYNVVDTTVVSSSQGPHSEGWQQSVSLKYTFDTLPPLEDIVNVFENEVDVTDYTRNWVNPLGPTFASTSALRYQFDIPSYPAR